MNYKYLLLITFFIINGCKEKYTPKPRGFFRISFPEKQFIPLNNQYPYQFDIPIYSKITPDRQNPDQHNWINIEIPENKAKMHISYYYMKNNNNKYMLAKFIEESRELAYKHTVKANAIEEQLFINPNENVYGTVYHIEGNAASPLQFFLTDSLQHFLRGALYIEATPDIDSLQPVINFLEGDIIRLIETTKWE